MRREIILLFETFLCIKEEREFRMQVIYKVDVVFRVIYSLLISMLGLVLFFLSGKWPILPLSVLAILAYLYMASRKNLKRYRAARQPFPREWRDILERCSAFYNHLDPGEKRRFEQDIRIFLSDFSIQGIRGQEVDQKTRLLIAAGAATLLHGRPAWEPPIKDGVLVYPGDRFDRDYQPGRGWQAGQASRGGPLIVTRGSLQHSFRESHDGYNVILHELAHYFDLEDGQADGIPGMGMSSENIAAWRTIMAREWGRAQQGRSFLDPYAGVNEAEFFAVATEFFFERPGEMRQKAPDLYEALRDFYNLDTERIFKR